MEASMLITELARSAQSPRLRRTSHSQFGEIVAGVERLLGRWTRLQWRDLVVAL
jgi:hypothetical protein